MKRLTAFVVALLCAAAHGTTLNPIQLLNPAGSSSGQAIVSTGASSAPAWGNVSAVALTGIVPIANGGTGVTSSTGTGSVVLSASPVFTGTPTAPTLAVGTNTTALATSQFVANHAPCPSILDYGGNNGGTGDNSAAFASAAAVGPSGQACVYFPAGTYAFSSNVTYTTPNTTGGITILGAGSDQTKLVWSGGGGLTVALKSQFNYARVRDLSILTGSTNAGSGLYINQTAASIANPAVTAPSDVTNVTFRGVDGYAVTDYWQYGIQVSGASNINFNGVNVFGASTPAGTGLYIWGSSSDIPVVFNITGSSFDQLNIGFQYGTYVQGVTITSSNFTQDNYGINVPASETGLDQLAVVNSQFNDYTYGIYVSSSLENVQLSNNLFIVYNNSCGAFLNATSVTTVTGNAFEPQSGSPTNANGLVFGTYVSGASIVTGNAFFSLTTGVWLQSASKYVNVQSNAYLSNTNTVVNSCTTGCTVGGGSQ